MSIFNSLTTAVSGMDSQATAFTNLGNNIANSQTVGYKADSTAFQDFVAGSRMAGDFTEAYSDSVAGLTVQHVDRQGQTVRSMDSMAMTINGNGLFNVAKGAGEATSGEPAFQGGYYTRNGEFYEDKNGYLVNPAGYYLEGYMTDADGKLDTTRLTEINVANNTQFRPTKTTTITQNAILPSHYVPGDANSYNINNTTKDPQSYQTQPVTTYDGLGKPHKIALAWQQSEYNPLAWTVRAYSADGTENVDGTTFNVNFDNEGHIKSVYTLGKDLGKSASKPDDGSVFKANDGHLFQLENPGSNFNELPDEPVNLQISVTPHDGNEETQMINLKLGAIGSSSGTTLQINPKMQPSDGSTLPTIQQNGNALTITPKNGATSFSLGDATGSDQAFMTAPITLFDNTQKHEAHEVALQFTEQSAAEQTWTAQMIDLNHGDKAVSKPITYKATPDTWQHGGSTPNSGNPTVDAENEGFVNLKTTDKLSFSDPTLSQFTINTPGNDSDNGGNPGVNLSVDSEVTPSVLTTDSVASGTFENAEISNDGSIMGVYDNGDTQLIGKVALTQFPDVNGLTLVDGQAYVASTQSGEPTTGLVGQNGNGTLAVGYVEASTTNLTSDLSNLIVAQEAYSANTKTVTTADELLQTTIAMKQS